MKNNQNYIKPSTPVNEFILIGSMVFITGIVIQQILKGSHEHIYVIPFPIAGLVFAYYFSNYSYKTIRLKDTGLSVKPLFGKHQVLNKENTKGYEIYEKFDYTGLVKQVRIVDEKNKKIIFVHFSYDDYDKVIRLIKSSDIVFLGEKEIKWRFKKQYATISIISFLIAMMFFLLIYTFKI